MKLIFIYGPPGVGKLTVAQELSRLTGFRLWDNHKSIDAVLPVFAFGMPPFMELVAEIRERVFEEAAREGIDLIFTMGYNHPDDVPYVERMVAPIQKHGGEVLFVQLTCAETVNEERFVAADRITTSKLTDLTTYRRMKRVYDLLTPIPDRHSLCIDNTEQTPAQVALQIIQHYGLSTIDAGPPHSSAREPPSLDFGLL